MEDATLGSSSGGTDFYVLQSLQDGTDCNVAYGAGAVSISGNEPTISGSQSTSTLTSLIDWPRGDNLFCLRMQLMLQMEDGADIVWHQMDFKFTVTVSFADGSTTVTYSGTGATESGTFEADGVQTGTGADTGLAPTFTTDLQGGPFAYGDDIPIEINFVHPLDVFTFNVAATQAIPVDEFGVQLKDTGGALIALRTASFTMTSTNHATGIKGTLTITLPLVMYQIAAISVARVSVPVSWTNKARRQLRVLQEEDATGVYTGPPNGVVDEVIEVELIPYKDESGAIIGFTVGGIVSTMWVGAAALLM